MVYTKFLAVENQFVMLLVTEFQVNYLLQFNCFVFDVMKLKLIYDLTVYEIPENCCEREGKCCFQREGESC